MTKNILIYQTNCDIPFPQGRAVIHQPTIKEISMIGTNTFLQGIKFLSFDKEMLSDEDKSKLKDKTNFQILQELLDSSEMKEIKIKALQTLSLLFPLYEVSLNKDQIDLKGLKEGTIDGFISARNFDLFSETIESLDGLFLLDQGEDGNYNPADNQAQRIIDKIKKGKEKIAKDRKTEEDEKQTDIYAKYLNVLSIGLSLSKNDLADYTPPQLIESYKRFINKLAYDSYVSAKMAGAKDIDEVKHWMLK